MILHRAARRRFGEHAMRIASIVAGAGSPRDAAARAVSSRRKAVPTVSTAPRLRGDAVRSIVAFLVVFYAAPLRAHDVFEIWTIAVLRTDHLELGITMAQSTALRLIDPAMKARALSVDNFATHRARLEREAAALCVLTSNRKPLAPRRVEVELTDENDVVFKVIYPRPAPGRLHFHAACLKKLGEGYGGIFDASDTTGNHLGWEQLSFENPNFELIIPTSPAPQK